MATPEQIKKVDEALRKSGGNKLVTSSDNVVPPAKIAGERGLATDRSLATELLVAGGFTAAEAGALICPASSFTSGEPDNALHPSGGEVPEEVTQTYQPVRRELEKKLAMRRQLRQKLAIAMCAGNPPTNPTAMDVILESAHEFALVYTQRWPNG